MINRERTVSIQGKTIVFTGRISKPRHEFWNLVREYGGIPSDHVSKSTDYLVVGEDPGSKLAKASLLGIKIISEPELLNLLTEPVEDEEPLTPEKLSEINLHRVTSTCEYCGGTYKQWDTLPDRGTCPLCEIKPSPRCPHCDDTPIYVEDFNLYYCFLCGTWFKAPFSINARKTKHLHLFSTERKTKDGSHKTCLCGYTVFLTNKDLEASRRQYNEAPSFSKVLKDRNEELKQEKKHKEWFNSLTEEQILHVRRQLAGQR